MYKKNYGGTLAEVMSIVVMLAIILLGIAIFVPALNQVSEKTRSGGCSSNLTQFRTALTQYQLDLGRQIYFPQKQGQGFLSNLYYEALLVESLVYICPSTSDTNDILVSPKTIFFDEVRIHGGEIENANELGDTDGPISYAGRINSNQDVYPGFFKIAQDTSTTPMISDDFCAPNESKVNENHQGGRVRAVLFLDGHTDYLRDNNYFRDDILFDVLRN